MDDFIKTSEKLGEVAAKPVPPSRTPRSLRRVKKACADCHKDFRVEEGQACRRCRSSGVRAAAPQPVSRQCDDRRVRRPSAGRFGVSRFDLLERRRKPGARRGPA